MYLMPPGGGSIVGRRGISLLWRRLISGSCCETMPTGWLPTYWSCLPNYYCFISNFNQAALAPLLNYFIIQTACSLFWMTGRGQKHNARWDCCVMVRFIFLMNPLSMNISLSECLICAWNECFIYCAHEYLKFKHWSILQKWQLKNPINTLCNC